MPAEPFGIKWLDNGDLLTHSVVPAVVTHPRTDEKYVNVILVHPDAWAFDLDRVRDRCPRVLRTILK